MGLPMYVSIDRKPENGCEIQNVACARSGVMLHLKVVKSANHATEEQESNDSTEQEEAVPHGGRVLMDLISQWYHTTRTVVADSYFASVL